MNPSKDFERINFNPFNFFNDQDRQGMRDIKYKIQNNKRSFCF